MNTFTISEGNILIYIEIDKNSLFSKLKRDSALKARAIASSANSFDQLAIADSDKDWFHDNAATIASELHLLISEYCIDFNNGRIYGLDTFQDKISYSLRLSTSFNPLLSSVLESLITDILSKSIISTWFIELLKPELIQIYQNELPVLKNSLLETVYKWRVVRDVAAFPTSVLDTTGTTENVLTVTVPKTGIVDAVSDSVNATLKSVYGTTDEYFSKAIGASETPAIERDAMSASMKLAETIGAYIRNITTAGANIVLTIGLSKNADPSVPLTICDRIYDALTSFTASKYFSTLQHEKEASSYEKSYSDAIAIISDQLYKWRVVRTVFSDSIVEYIEHEDHAHIVIGLPRDTIIAKIPEEINASLKSLLASTLEYEKYCFKDAENAVIENGIIQELSVIASSTTAYLVQYFSDITGEDLSVIVDELKQVVHTPTANTDLYVAYSFSVPLTYDKAVLRLLEAAIKQTIIYAVYCQYSLQIGTNKVYEVVSSIYADNKRKISTLLHRRTYSIKRSGELFS